MNSKDLRNIDQAYSSIYEEQIEAGQHPGKSPDKRTRDKFETQSRRGTAPKGVGVPDKSVGYGQLKQDVDMFELVKGYLIAEGFAETEEAAVAIMANMSEEWRNYITEGPVGEFADAAARTLGSGVGAIERGIKHGPKYLMKKVKNVKGTFDDARERARENIPPNMVKAPKKATANKPPTGSSAPTPRPYNQGGPRLPGRDM